MNAPEVLAELFRITGSLEPVSPATPEDLEELRRRLAHSLFDAPAGGVSTLVPADEASRPIRAVLDASVTRVALERATPGASPRRAHLARRELPLHSLNLPVSFPARSGAQAVRRTFGPMLESRERLVHFDLFEAAPFVRVVCGALPPFALLPPATQAADATTFAFGSGSVWIQAERLAPGASGFAGLRVREGTLVVRTGGSLANQMLHVSPNAACTLTLTLEPPAIDAPPPGPGQDAGAAAAARPNKVRFELEAQGAAQIDCDDGAVTVYGATIALTRSNRPAEVSALTGGVLVPFDPSPGHVTPQEVRSTLLQPSGTWELASGAWILPVSLAAGADDLGEAADAGAMAVVVRRGLTAAWHRLAGGVYTADRAMVLVDSHELALVAEGRTPRIARLDLALWRASSIEVLHHDAFRLQFVASRNGAEVCGVTATIDAHLDRPLRADGRRTRLRIPGARVFLSHHPDGDEMVNLVARRQIDPNEVVPLALANALLQATPPDELRLFGLLGDADQGGERAQVAGASLRLEHGLLAILPFLPDPYAANFELPRERMGGRARARLSVVTTWSGPESPALVLSMAPLDADAANLPRLLLPPGRPLPEEPDNERFLADLFNRTISPRATPGPPLLLLDLSSHAAQFGVGTAFPEARAVRPELTFAGVHLAAAASDLRVVALPQVQWEPVRTHPPDLEPNFPQPLISKDDGGPLVATVQPDSVRLVPVAPEPLLREVVAAAARPESAFAIRFTLPFGIKAIAVVGPDLPPSERPLLGLNRPKFGPFTGGLQISLRASTPAGIPGGAIQTRNSVSAQPQSVLDVAEGFFNARFHPGNMIKHVPVSRVDFSGYGESTFSKWVNENAAAIDVTKVEFDVLTGRTSYEVVEIQSILWPCMARVVRRITIRREGNGAVLRRDSGWVAATPGLFVRSDSACVFHTGVVKGMHNIREIRDTPRRVRLASNVDLQAVYFDTDVAFEEVARGQAFDGPGPHGQRVGFVPSQRQLGFVQLINLNSVQTSPLNPMQVQELLDNHGPVGGPIDCELNIGRSGQSIRAASVFAVTARHPGGVTPHFALGTYGAPELPREGQWTVVRVKSDPLGGFEPEPADPGLGVPLIRAGDTTVAPGANPHPYRFADPADLLQPAQPAFDYAWLLATDTFRTLFRRLKIEPGSAQLTSDLPPVLADAFSMIGSTGLFPRLKQAITFPTSAYELRILGGGRLRLSPSPLAHTMPARVLDVVKASGIHVFTEYRGGDRHRPGPARIELRFDSSAQPSWHLKIGPVSNVTDIDPFGPLMRMISTIEAASDARARGTKPLIEFGGALRPVEELITVLKELGLPEDLLVDTPNSPEPERAFKFKAARKFKYPETHILGKMKAELTAGVEFGTQHAKHAILPVPVPGIAILGPMADPLGSVELFAEFEGTVQLPIIKPLLYGGGMIRLKFVTGFDPSEPDPIVRKIELAAAAVGSVGGHFAKGLAKAEAQVRYGYVFVADIANEEYHPGVLVGLALTLEIGPEKATVAKISFEAEVIGLVLRVDEETIKVKAKFTIAGEVEICEVVDVEYAFELEWEPELPMKAIAGLALAIQLGVLPLPIPP